jgi:tetratricopeptide (TPR) repeat protein
MTAHKNLLKWYQNLSVAEKQSLKDIFANSPKAYRCLSYLENIKSDNFIEQSKLITHIYKEELQNTEYKVIENRFFKLRKKIIESIQKPSLLAPKDETLTEEEKVWLKLRHDIQKNDFHELLPKLISLYETLKNRNIFELMPSVIDGIINYYQIFRTKGEVKPWIEEWKKASDLLQEWESHKTDVRTAYQNIIEFGFESARSILSDMKKRAKKMQEYPRFSMVYHYTYVNSKIHDASKDFRITEKNFKELFAIHEQNPYTPLVVYRANYIRETEFAIKFQWKLFLCRLQRYQQALSISDEIWSDVQEGNIPSSEALYTNRVYVQCAANAYKEAIDTVKEYIQFLRQNKKRSRLIYAYTQLVAAYSVGFPDIPLQNTDFFKKQFFEYIKEVEKNPDILEATFRIEDLYALKVMYLCIIGDIKEAIQYYPKASLYFEKHEVPFMKNFLDILLHFKDNTWQDYNDELDILLKNIRTLLEKVPEGTPTNLSMPYWMEKILKWYISNT